MNDLGRHQRKESAPNFHFHDLILAEMDAKFKSQVTYVVKLNTIHPIFYAYFPTHFW